MTNNEVGFLSVDYEIHGNVQGVFFRQYTLEEAAGCGAVGWVMNTEKGTVKGTVQGTKEQVDKMKWFLANKGSPTCQILKADFCNERRVVHLEYKRFTVSSGDW